MKLRTRIVAAVTVSLVLVGSLAPLAAAQAPAQPVQPGIFREAPKAPLERDGMVAEDRTLPPAAYDVAAGVATGFLVPGRAITCVLGGTLGVAALLATFGSGYQFATRIVEEGCGGRWVVTGRDLAPAHPPAEPR